MKKIFSIAKWEYLEKVKTKAFFISLIITPAIIILFSILPGLLAHEQSDFTKFFGVIDPSNKFFDKLEEEISKFKLENEQPKYVVINLLRKNVSLVENLFAADSIVLKNAFEGYIYIFDFGDDSVNVEFRSKTEGDFEDLKRIEDAINNVRINKKLRDEKIDSNLLSFINKKVKVESIKIDKAGSKKDLDFITTFYSSLVFIILLMLMIIYSGQMLVRSLLEEKSNRLIEILISSCKTDELLTGKILGLSALGLTQLFIWSLIGLGLTGYAVIPLSVFPNLPQLILYFVLGFTFYTTLFVGIGSIVSTEQEAQQMTSYLSLILIIPIIIILPAMQNPNSLLINILTYIPLTSPSVMILRLNISDVSVTDLCLTTSIMLLSIFITIKISAKIFRIGILSYGKMPSLKELKIWINEK